MSQDSQHHEDIAYPPHVAQMKVIDARIDGSDEIFTLYLEISLREDEKMIEVWNQDAKSMILFSGLFSATIAAALGPTLPDLTVTPEDLSAAYLQLIYDKLNGLSPFSDDGVDFGSLVTFQLVNSLWFSSLVISLTCALLAVSLQQWTRRYLMDVRRRDTPCNQARIRAYLAEGLFESRIAVLMDVMRACHQLSFFLFTLGLFEYFSSTDTPTSIIVAIWFVIWYLQYAWMSMTAISRNNSPYRSPLSSIFYRFIQLIYLALSKTPARKAFAWRRPEVTDSNRNRSSFQFRKLSPEGMREAIEESVLKASEHLDIRILEWTFHSLNQNREFERFFAGIPDFCNSRTVNNPEDNLPKLKSLPCSLFVWMHQTVRSHSISESARQQRIKIFTGAIDAVPNLVSWSTLSHIFGEWEGLLESVDFGSAILRTGGNRTGDPHTVCYDRCIVAIVIARTQRDDGDWTTLETQFFALDIEGQDPTSRTLQNFLKQGDTSSVLLGILISITWTIFQFHSEPLKGKLCKVSSETLRELSSKIDVPKTSTEMQNEFCHLWNTLVRHRDDERVRAHNAAGLYAPVFTEEILRYLNSIFNHLHQGADAAQPGDLYHLCLVENHSHTSSQPPSQTTANPPNSPSSRPPLSAPLDVTPQNPVIGVTGASDASEVPSLAEATFNPQTRMPPSVDIGPPLLTSSDGAPAAPPDLTSSS